jgi:hypothetical protein
MSDAPPAEPESSRVARLVSCDRKLIVDSGRPASTFRDQPLIVAFAQG